MDAMRHLWQHGRARLNRLLNKSVALDDLQIVLHVPVGNPVH